MSEKEHEEKLLTADEVAKRLSLDRETVYRWIRDGSLKSIKIGKSPIRKRIRVRESDLQEFIKTTA